MNPNQDVHVTYSDFLTELERELKYLKSDGKTYRSETAEMSVMIAKKVKDVNPFTDRESAFETVSNLLPNTDLERLKDVSKRLNVI